MGVADRPRDLWDVLARLQNLASPDIEVQGETLDAFQSPTPESIPLTDAVTLPNLHHTGVYFWNNGTSIWGRAQWG